MERPGLRVNAPQVIHETIDGEVVVINLGSGTYYSLRGAGADVWDVIQSAPGADRRSIAAALARRFDRPADALENEIASFLEQLSEEELIAEADADGLPSSTPVSNGTSEASGEPRTFEPPLLEKYTDMQDLVLIDPVHEVDTAGWPHRKPDVAKT